MLFICSYIEQHLRFEHLTYQRLQNDIFSLFGFIANNNFFIKYII